MSIFMLFINLENGQRDVIFHGEKPYGTYYQERNDDRHAYIEPSNHQSPIGKSAQDAGHGIDLFAKYHRHIVEQDIAYHATGRTGDATHYYGNPERMTAVDGFL